jgi:hypothetical protein
MADVPINILNTINKILLNGKNNGRDPPQIINKDEYKNIERDILRKAEINQLSINDILMSGNLLSDINGQDKIDRENDILSLSEEEIGEALATILNCGLNFVTAVRNLSTVGITVKKVLLQPESNQGENNVVSRIKVIKSIELTRDKLIDQQQIIQQNEKERIEREQRRQEEQEQKIKDSKVGYTNDSGLFIPYNYYDSRGVAFYINSQGQPYYHGNQNQLLYFSNNSQNYYDTGNIPFYINVQGQHYPYYLDGQGQPYYYDSQGQPYYYDSQGQPYYYDSQGNIHYYSQYGGSVKLKEDYSETSSINGSFLNNRIGKHLKHSMLGGGSDREEDNSDTLANITELQIKNK